jgi:hypothetical protein
MAKDPNHSVATVLRLYCDLMEEIKVRVAALQVATSGRLSVHHLVAFEFCHLELRIVCELIALACLVAHGDIQATQTGRLKSAYQADLILKSLESLHPNFFPVPGTQIRDAAGRPLRVEKVESGFLTKSDLIGLYADCGRALHRGSLKNLRPNLNAAISFKEVARATERTIRLLNHHQIALHNSTRQIWVIMEASADGRVHAALMERFEGPAPR